MLFRNRKPDRHNAPRLRIATPILRAGNRDYFFYNDRMVDINLIIDDIKSRCNGSDNHVVAQELSKLRLTAHALWRGDQVDGDMVARALTRLGRGWMIE